MNESIKIYTDGKNIYCNYYLGDESDGLLIRKATIDYFKNIKMQRLFNEIAKLENMSLYDVVKLIFENAVDNNEVVIDFGIIEDDTFNMEDIFSNSTITTYFNSQYHCIEITNAFISSPAGTDETLLVKHVPSGNVDINKGNNNIISHEHKLVFDNDLYELSQYDMALTGMAFMDDEEDDEDDDFDVHQAKSNSVYGEDEDDD